MRFFATILIAVLVFSHHGLASPTLRSAFNVVPYGMAEFGPFRGKNLAQVMPRSKNLTQIDRLNWSEKCRPFRRRCSMAEHCCSMKCLVHIQRCNA